jgi:hypothetical protein
MPSTGTKQTGFATADAGPFQCANCQKWRSGVCMDSEVAADKDVPGRTRRLTFDGHIRTQPEECCNEFLSLKDHSGQMTSRGGSSGIGERLLATIGARHLSGDGPSSR